MIDWKELFIHYMKHVLDSEGTDFLYADNDVNFLINTCKLNKEAANELIELINKKHLEWDGK